MADSEEYGEQENVQKMGVSLFGRPSADRLDIPDRWTLVVTQKDGSNATFSVHCTRAAPMYLDIGEGADSHAMDIYCEGLYNHALENESVEKVTQDPLKDYWSVVTRLKDPHLLQLIFDCQDNHELFLANHPNTIMLRYHMASGDVIQMFQIDISPMAFRSDKKRSEKSRANYNVNFNSRLGVSEPRRLQMLMQVEIDRDPFSGKKNLQNVVLYGNQKLFASLIAGHRADVTKEPIPIMI